ncbi:MAG: hypothetical protein NC078_11080 [Ruminococcus sp.]|nr:hypothetical protein [Ruminococcus sp.]
MNIKKTFSRFLGGLSAGAMAAAMLTGVSGAGVFDASVEVSAAARDFVIE